jgi:hypothetical protein
MERVDIGNWRITFTLDNGEVCNLNLEEFRPRLSASDAGVIRPFQNGPCGMGLFALRCSV